MASPPSVRASTVRERDSEVREGKKHNIRFQLYSYIVWQNSPVQVWQQRQCVAEGWKKYSRCIDAVTEIQWNSIQKGVHSS